MTIAGPLSVVSFDPVAIGVAGADRRSTSRRATMSGVAHLRIVSSSAWSDDPVTVAIRRAADGDQAAFAEFYDHIAPIVYGTVKRIVRDDAISEEVTQDVFVELWRLAPRFDADRGSPQGWASTIARRRAIDRVRSEQSSRDREQADWARGDRPSDDVADDVVASEERSEVVDALDALTQPQREAVTLAYYGGHTYRDVARMLDVPEGTVKTRIRDGLIRLRAAMGAAP